MHHLGSVGRGSSLTQLTPADRKGQGDSASRLEPAGANPLGAKGELKNAPAMRKPEKEGFTGKLLSLFGVRSQPKVPEQTLRAQAAVMVALETTPGYRQMAGAGWDASRFVDRVLEIARRQNLPPDRFTQIATHVLDRGEVEKNGLVVARGPANVRQDDKAASLQRDAKQQAPSELQLHQVQVDDKRAQDAARLAGSRPAGAAARAANSDSRVLAGRHFEVMVTVTKVSLQKDFSALVNAGKLAPPLRDALVQHFEDWSAAIKDVGASKADIRALASRLREQARANDMQAIPELLRPKSVDI